MSADSKNTFIPDPSQGEYWGGYMLDAWFFKVLAIVPFTGFLGIDHLALRSPFTAFLKCLVNIFFYGAWYFYDIIQVFIDDTFIAKYGFSTPYGPRGHGFQLFHNLTENNLEELAEPSKFSGGLIGSFLFILYSLFTLFFGFTGLPSLMVGDFYGGIVKFLTLFLIFTIPFYIFGNIMDFFTKSAIEKTGVPRPWPVYPGFMLKETHPASYLLPAEESAKQVKAYQDSVDALVKEGVQPSVPSLLTAIKDMIWQGLVQFPAFAAFQTVGAAREGVAAASQVGQSLAKAIQKKMAKDPDAVIDQLIGPAAAPPIEVKESFEVENHMKQKGGGIFEGNGDLDLFMMSGMAILIIGGLAAAFFRKISLPKEKEDNERPRKVYERDDAPPKPGAV